MGNLKQRKGRYLMLEAYRVTVGLIPNDERHGSLKRLFHLALPEAVMAIVA